MKKMLIKLTRDDARSVQQYFFPYLDQLTAAKIRDSKHDIDLQLHCKVIRSIYFELARILEKKLAGDALKFSWKLTDAQGITLYKLLLVLPIPNDQYYLIHLRQNMINILHLQIL